MKPNLFAWRPTATACLLVTGLLVGSQLLAADPAAPARPALTVTTARPASAQLPIRISANGSIAAWQEASVGAEVNGLRLAEVRFNVGDVVKAGEVLAVYAAESVQAELAQARAALLEAEASAAEATANAQRARSLQDSGALSQQQIGQFTTGEQTARARVEAARATLEAQQLRLRQTRVLAPDAGVISARSATVGAVSAPGTELFRLIRQGRLEWRAEVTSAELARLHPGLNVTLTSASGTRVAGKVRMVAPTVDPQTRNALVYVDLPSVSASNPGIKAGMFARGDIELGGSAALTVPQQAVVMRDGFEYVFRVQGDSGAASKVQQIKVKTGRRSEDRVEILSGLPGDARVVLQGAGFLNDGDLVKLVDAPAGKASAAKP